MNEELRTYGYFPTRLQSRIQNSTMQGQNPFSTFLLVLLVVSWTGAQQLQRGFGAAQGRPGATPFLLQRGAAVGVSGGSGLKTAAEGTSLPPIPVLRSTIGDVQGRDNRAGHALGENEQEAIFREQARNAKYSFSSSVEDSLNDQMVSKQETRDGLQVKGSYSYRDGYFERTVHYEADENGYRVIGDETKAIGDGPNPNPNGKAEVINDFGGARSEYAISAADLQRDDLINSRSNLEKEGRLVFRNN